MRKKIRYGIELASIYLLLITCKCLGYRYASNMGGWLARKIGPHLKSHKTASDNIKKAYPSMNNEELDIFLHNMWDNLGRTFTEYAHLAMLFSEKGDKYIEVRNLEVLEKLETSTQPIIYLSAHKGNWEIPPIALSRLGYNCSIAYRAANNKWANTLIQKLRKVHRNPMYPKGKIAAKEFINDLKNKRNIGLLIDQKMNDGIAAPFFGRAAMTAPAAAQFYQKYDTHLVYLDVTRRNKHHFLIEIHSLDHIEKHDTTQIMTDINAFYETCIQKEPEQWMWVHRRWPKE